eukprot:1159902-Pelagomonas_calceolata.AAC.3
MNAPKYKYTVSLPLYIQSKDTDGQDVVLYRVNVILQPWDPQQQHISSTSAHPKAPPFFVLRRYSQFRTESGASRNHAAGKGPHTPTQARFKPEGCQGENLIPADSFLKLNVPLLRGQSTGRDLPALLQSNLVALPTTVASK